MSQTKDIGPNKPKSEFFKSLSKLKQGKMTGVITILLLLLYYYTTELLKKTLKKIPSIRNLKW